MQKWIKRLKLLIIIFQLLRELKDTTLALNRTYILALVIFLFVGNLTTFADNKVEISPIVSNNNLSKINNLLDSCWSYRTKNPTLALQFGQNALTLINDNKLIKIKPKTLNYLGVVHRKLGDLEQSHNYFIQALDIAKLIKDSTQIGYTYNNLTDYYIKKASYSTALENILKSYQIFKKLENKIGMAYSLNYLGEIYITQEDYEKALSYLSEASLIRQELNDLRGYSNTLTNIGVIYFKKNNFEKALEYYDKSMKINKEISYLKGNSKVLSHKGDIFFKKNEFKRAYKNIHAALHIDKKLKNRAGQIENLNKLGLVYLKLRNYKDAKLSLDEANKMAKESGHLDQEMISYLNLSNYYSTRNDYYDAHKYLEKYLVLKDSIYSHENMGKFADLQTLFATNKKEIENKLLLKEVEFRERTNYYLVFISIITFFIIILLISKFRTQKKSNNILNELNSSKDKFFSIMAHDLKNPFQGLLGYTEILHKEYDTLEEDEVRESIASLYSVTRSVYSLLEGLLEWSRAQTGRMEYNPTLFKLSEESKVVVELSKDAALAKNISLTSDIDETILVYADRNMISTTLRNLVTNAIKFTNSGNIVKINA